MGKAGKTGKLWEREFWKDGVNQLAEKQNGNKRESKQYVGTIFQ